MTKVVILAGGLGTRLAEETDIRPKPMVSIGEHPILWHIMKHYSFYGFKEFYIALGYKGEVIKRYFLDYSQSNADYLTVSLATGDVTVNEPKTDDWVVHLVNTGFETNTGGRLKRLEQWLRPTGTFMLTYGDGVCNVNVQNLLEFHRSHGCIATVTAVRPPARFGSLRLDNEAVLSFQEKPQTDSAWINGGFFVFEPAIFDYLKDDRTVLEADALERLAGDSQLVAYQHFDFWQCMDTLRDKRYLESLWQSGQSPWKVW